MSSTHAAEAPNRRPSTFGATEFALLAAVSLAWGTSYMFTKIAVASIPPVSLIALRTTIAAALMMSYLLWRGMPKLGGRDLASLALVGLAANAAPLCLIAISVSHVDSSVTATTMALVPLITAFYAVFRHEYPSVRNVVGILVGLAGIAVLFGPEALTSFNDSSRGLLAAIAAALIFSGSLFTMPLVSHHKPIAITAVSLVFSALWTAPLALALDGVPQAWPEMAGISATLVLAVWNTAAASMLLFALAPRAGPAFTSYNNYLVPAVSILCGTVFLGEALTARSVAGVGLVLAGVAISTLKGRSAAPPVP